MCHPAFAKDLPHTIKPTPFVDVDHWSGAYIGLLAGAADGHSSFASTVGCPVNGFLCDPVHYPENGALLGATASGSRSNVGFTAGVFAGYNFRASNFVFGVESDVSSLHLRLNRGGSASSLNLGLTNPGPVPVVATVNAAAAVDWLATFRGRIGFLASPDVLLYATGGLALTNVSVSNSYTDNWVFNGGAVGNSKATADKTGYAVGAGGEWSLGRNWTLRAEYLRVGFDSLTTSATIYVVQVSRVPRVRSREFWQSDGQPVPQRAQL